MFRSITLAFFLSLQIFPYLQAQNLVNNPGFENIECLTESYCGAQQYEVKLIADFWWSANDGSPDIFSPCNDVFDPLDSTYIWCDGWGVPNNWLGYKFARSGQNYGGYFSGVIYFKDSIIPDRKEFLAGSLKEPLRSGRKYCTGLYITPAMKYLVKNNKKLFFYYVTDHSDIYFSSFRLFSPTRNSPQVIPQVVLKSDHHQYIADTSGWERLYAPYIASGGEQYLTIGNFTPPAQMIMHLVTNMSQAFIDSSGGCMAHVYTTLTT
jgi:OOP family OmpA-OmpF porin